MLVAEAVVGARAHGLRARARHRRVELDTQLFFRESYETRDRLVERYGLNADPPPQVITVAEQHRQEGPNLWERDPDRCCHIRKVEPLLQALEPYDAWISGIRRDQSPSRADTPKVRVVGALRASGSCTRSPTGTRSASGPTSRSTRFPTTRCTTSATARSAASPARGRRAGRGGARRPLGRLRQARVRDPPRDATRRHMTDHIYAARAPRVRRTSGPAASRSGSPGSPARARRRSRTSSGPSSTAAASSSSTSTATPCARTSRRASASRRRTATRTSSAIGWVASRLTRQGGAVIAAAISPYAETRQQARELVEQFGTLRRGLRQGLGRGVRAARREGSLREGVHGRDQGLHRRRDPVRGAGEPGARDRHRGARAGGERRRSSSRSSRSSGLVPGGR